MQKLFDFEMGALPVAADVGTLFSEAWRDLGGPGSGWSGQERVALAEAARAARGHAVVAPDLPESAGDVVKILTREPAVIDASMVADVVARLGIVRYVEMVGVVSMVIAVDTLTSLLGIGIEPLPAPVAGEPLPPGRIPGLKLRKAWVPTTGLPLPRLALGAAPPIQKLTNRVLDRLYMDPDQSREVQTIRGLSPIQMELVVVSVSHGNKCFYCTLGHLVMLHGIARRTGVELDPVAIVDPTLDSGIPGGRELIALSRSAVTTNPDPETVQRVSAALGPDAAVTAAEVASAFMMTNRIVEATGQPALERQRERMLPILEQIGAIDFPHSGLTTVPDKPGPLQRVARRLRAGR